MQTNLFIPKKIHIGFQERDDTYTGKLAYIIYEDEKGQLRKKESWNGWCDSDIEKIVLDNTPAKFVLNKGVQRNGYWGSGRSVIRIYDERDFEFEINIDNLIGILMHSDLSKRDIQQECVFAWAGKDLVLLPTNSEEYEQSLQYTAKQSLKISSKELIKGYTYGQKKNNDIYVYMGFYDFYEFNYNQEQKSYGKKHVFYNLSSKLFSCPSIGTFSNVVSSEIHTDFATFNENLFKSNHLHKFESIELSNTHPVNGHGYHMKFFKEFNNQIYSFSYYSGYNNISIYSILNSFQKVSIDTESDNFKIDVYGKLEISELELLLKDLDLNYDIKRTNSHYNRNFDIKGNVADLSTKDLKNTFKNKKWFCNLNVVSQNGSYPIY